MKTRLIIICFFVNGLVNGLVNADEGKERDVNNPSPKEGETIWLEEKISPTTRWLENLVKPLTVWMEQQINEPAQEPSEEESPGESTQESIHVDDQQSNKPSEASNSLDIDQTATTDAPPEPASLISAEQANALAKEHIAGEVLFIKLLANTNRYRVKLISELGEIHIIYIRASTGEIISPNTNVQAEPAKLPSAERESQINAVPDAQDESKEAP